MKGYRSIGFFSAIVLMIAILGGCDNKQENTKNASQQTTHKPKVKATQQDSVAEAPRETIIRDLTGSAAEYNELHTLFCKQHKDIILNQREIKRLANLEDLAEAFTDADHMNMYRKAHNPENC